MDAVTVVNLHAYDRHWASRTWRGVGLGNPDLNVLGIDIYRTHFWTGTRGDKRRMKRLSAEYGKPWWIVEMEGAPSPTRWPGREGHSGVPDVDTCRRWAEECERYGAMVAVGQLRALRDRVRHRLQHLPGPGRPCQGDHRGRQELRRHD